MRVVDVRAEARAYMAERELRPGYYWARTAGTDDPPQPVHLDDDGFVWVIGWDSHHALEGLEVGRRIEVPEMPGTVAPCRGCGARSGSTHSSRCEP